MKGIRFKKIEVSLNDRDKLEQKINEFIISYNKDIIDIVVHPIFGSVMKSYEVFITYKL